MFAASRRSCLLAALTALSVVACTPLPEAPTVRGLYVDIRKAVDFREQIDWVADRLETTETLAGVMGSVCRTDAQTRRDTLTWLDQRIAEEGGPSEEVYRREGRRTSQVKRIQTLERTRMVLERAHDIADDECPYWLEAEDDFRGLQGDEARFVILADSMGGASLNFLDGERSFGGGGAGRILLGFGVTRRLTIAIGAGVGADGILPETTSGTRSFEALLTVQVPVVFRVNMISRVLDIGVDVTTRLRNDDFQTPGVRFSLGYGLSTPRTSSLMPYVLAWVGYEVTPTGGQVAHTLWLGTKVGFDWDP